jgi:hypothetical protein
LHAAWEVEEVGVKAKKLEKVIKLLESKRDDVLNP